MYLWTSYISVTWMCQGAINYWIIIGLLNLNPCSMLRTWDNTSSGLREVVVNWHTRSYDKSFLSRIILRFFLLVTKWIGKSSVILSILPCISNVLAMINSLNSVLSFLILIINSFSLQQSPIDFISSFSLLSIFEASLSG